MINEIHLIDGVQTKVWIHKTLDGVWVSWPAHTKFVPLKRVNAGAQESSDIVKAPMTGKVIDVHKASGDAVQKDELLVVLEAMKMEYRLLAPRDGVVSEVLCGKDDLVELDEVLIRLIDDGAE